MSFKDFNDDGPGTFVWDYVLGGNTTGLFPEETYYEIDGDLLTQITFKHTGGNKFEPVYGLSWTIHNIAVTQDNIGRRIFTFEQDGCSFRAIENKKFSNCDSVIVDIEQL